MQSLSKYDLELLNNVANKRLIIMEGLTHATESRVAIDTNTLSQLLGAFFLLYNNSYEHGCMPKPTKLGTVINESIH